MSSSMRFNFADNRVDVDQYYTGFNLAMKIRKGVAFTKWSEQERKLLSACCYSTVSTHFLRFPHEEDYRVGRILRHLFNVRDRRPPAFIRRIYESIAAEERDGFKSLVTPLSLALIRNTPVRPAHLPPIR